MKKVKRIHFVGIKGVGLTPLAIIAKEAGIKVTGSDIGEVFITDKALAEVGIVPLVGFSQSHITDDIELVITTGAHGGYDNVEVIEAKKRGIPVITKGEAVGEFMEGSILGKTFTGISIAGSHGKTTTSSMLVTILKECGLDPSYVVGTGSIGKISLPGHSGKGEYFIAEADEYATEPKYNKKAQFLWQNPHIVLFTNIEHDHPDMYPSLEDVINVFEDLSSRLSADGVLVGCGDDQKVYSIMQKSTNKTLSYGFSPKNKYIISRFYVSGAQTFFRVETEGLDLGEFRLQVTGEHNALNALGACVVALELGLPLEKIKSAIATFTGAKRRLEYKGQLESGAFIFDDYAHHPTEIQKTLQGLRARFPREKIVCVFQPHTYSRTKTLFSEFMRAFSGSDEIIITDIYASLREQADPTVTAKHFVEELSRHERNVLHLPSLTDVVEYVKKNRYKDNAVLVFMGAGDIYKAIDELPVHS